VSERLVFVSIRRKWLPSAIFAAICGLYLVGGYLGWLTRSQENSGSWGTGSLAPSVAFAVTTLIFPVVGFLIATRRPGNAIAWLLLAIGIAWGLDAIAASYATYALEMHHGSHRAGLFAAAFDNVLWLPAIGLTGVFLVLLFPNGHLLSPRWRWLAWLAGTTIGLGSVAILLDPGRMTGSSFPAAVNPLGIEALGGILPWLRAAEILLPVTILASAVSLILRYRRARGDERLQMKWLVTAAGVVAGIFGVVEIASVLLEGPSNSVPVWLQTLQDVALISFGLIPTSIGFAVLRYRLYDIDVIIRRTLTYTCVAAVLVTLYLGGVAILSTAFRTLIGESGSLAVTLSTLVAAAAFRPLHRHTQRTVDRRFSRVAYDAARTLERFSGRLREQIDLDALTGEVLAVVIDTVQPSQASLWLCPPRVSG
jgi:uncharacterized membrane protein YidH (DUF202 family)